MNVSIRNYKSIRALDFESRRVNVIIGEPNCGKTNVIEALALCWPGVLEKGSSCLRMNRAAELFADQDGTREISAKVGEMSASLSFADGGSLLQLVIRFGKVRSRFLFNNTRPLEARRAGQFDEDLDDNDYKLKPFIFNPQAVFDDARVSSLTPPFGSNLPSLLLSHRESRETAAGLFQGTGFAIQVNVAEQSISVSKSVDGLVFSFPYQAASETLRRMLFYRLAVETNQNSILLFDEPEANTFPMFTKLFAEQIAADDRGNTFFLTTHSPYLLGSLIEKTPKEELAVVLCHMEDFETKARVLDQSEVQSLLDLGADAFFNLDRLNGE